MKYLVRFMCVLALGVIPVVGCSDNEGTGGSGGSAGTGGSGGSAGTGGSGGSAGTGGSGGSAGTGGTGACADWAGEWTLSGVSCDGVAESVPSADYNFAADCTAQMTITESATCMSTTQFTFLPEAGGTTVDPGAITCSAGCTAGECQATADGGQPYTSTISRSGDTLTSTTPVTAQMVSDELSPCQAGETMVSVLTRKTAGGPSDQVTCTESFPCTVWLLGNSNTIGMANNFASIDMAHPEYDTVNLGREGASSADGLAHVGSLLATEEAPEIAVVTYAGGDLLESYPAAPPGATSPTRDEVNQIYANLQAICELLQSEGTYCVLGKSIGALTELHPLDEGLPPGSIDFAILTYFDNGYVLVGEAIEERYQPGWVSFRVPKDFDLWDHGNWFGYVHLTEAGYSMMSNRLEAKLDDLIISQQSQ